MSFSQAHALRQKLEDAFDAGQPFPLPLFQDALARIVANPAHRAEDLFPLWRPAMKTGEPAFLEALLQAGARVDYAPADASTPLGHAFLFAQSSGSTTPCERLLAAGASPDSLVAEGEAPCLARALSAGMSDAALLFIRAGADVALRRPESGLTYLHDAARIDDAAAAAELLLRGADPSATCAMGLTPLQTAEMLNYEACAGVIRSFIEAQELRGSTPAASPRRTALL